MKGSRSVSVVQRLEVGYAPGFHEGGTVQMSGTNILVPLMSMAGLTK